MTSVRRTKTSVIQEGSPCRST